MNTLAQRPNQTAREAARLPTKDSKRAREGERPREPGRTSNKWTWTTLTNIVERTDYGITASADFAKTGPRLLRITDIQDGKVDWTKVPGCAISTTDAAENALLDGDIVFARTGATTGKSYLIRDPPDAVCASYLIRLRPKSDVCSEYLSLFFQSEYYWKQIHGKVRGGAQPNFNASMLAVLDVPLPPLPTQRRIAAELKLQLAEVDRARAALQAQLEAAKALPAASLRAVFGDAARGDARPPSKDSARNREGERLHAAISPTEEKELCLHNSATKWIRIRDLAETCSGTTPSRGTQEFYGGSIPWVKTGELRDDVITETEEHVTEEALRRSSLRLLLKGTLLIAMYGQGQTRGRTGLLGCPATTNQACFAILPNPQFDPEFMQFWFRASYQRLRTQTEGRGGNQPNLSGELLNQELVPLPPLPVQRTLAAKLRSEITAATDLRTRLEARLATLDRLPAALLRQVFGDHEGGC